jgi:hypothetical protein
MVMTVTSALRTIRAPTSPEIELKIASTRAEREAAFQLVYRSYVRAGLCPVRASGLRVTRYQLQRSTDIFIAKLRGEVIGTLSLVHDDRLGLPMEQVYTREVAERRGKGLRLAEISCLASRQISVARNFSLYCDLCSHMIQFAKKMEIDQVLAVVHPRHAPLYRRYMAFEQIGEYRDYPAVQNNPGVALCLDVVHVEENLPPAGWKSFFGTRMPDSVLCPQPIKSADIEYFRAAIQDDDWPNRLAVESATSVVGVATSAPDSSGIAMTDKVDGHVNGHQPICA